MTVLKRGMIIDIDLDPVKGSETGKIRPHQLCVPGVALAGIDRKTLGLTQGSLRRGICIHSGSCPPCRP